MQVTWLIQTNMGSQSDINNYVEAVKNTGATVIEVSHIPFSDSIPNVEILGPVVCYGSISFIKAIEKSGKYPLSIFADENTFTYENWNKYYENLLLNSSDNIQLMTIQDFCSTKIPDDKLIFVRPQHDTKSLVGAVYQTDEFKQWCITASTGVFAGVDKDTPIIIGKPYGIEAEWRLFIVDNKVVGASQYKKNNRLFKQEGAPDDILEFARLVISKWNPSPVYTLDLCHSAGNCYIVEAQSFNSAGIYDCNMDEVIKAVNKVAIRIYNNTYSKTLKP